LNQRLAIGHVKAIAIEVREHPLVRVEAVAIGELEAIVDVAKLGQSAAVPDMAASTCSQIVCSRQMCPISATGSRHSMMLCHSCANKAGDQPVLAILLDSLRQCVRPHREFLVHCDQPQVVASQSGDLNRFFD